MTPVKELGVASVETKRVCAVHSASPLSRKVYSSAVASTASVSSPAGAGTSAASISMSPTTRRTCTRRPACVRVTKIS